VHFDLSAEQEAVRDAARRFIDERWSADAARAALDRPPATLPSALWAELAELGWIGIAIDEAHGGSGQEVLAAALIAIEAGRGLLPGPLLSALAAAMILERCAPCPVRERWLADLAAGRKRATVAIEEFGGCWGPDAVRAAAAGDAHRGGTLAATKILVPDAEGADLLLVAARVHGRPRLLAFEPGARGLSLEPMQRMDGHALARLCLQDAPFDSGAILAESGTDTPLLEHGYDLWTVLLAADLLGTGEAALDMTTRYAGERVQFGRPIGTFQAVSHRLADVFVNLEIGRSLLYGACLALQEGRADAPALVSAAKAWLGDAAVHATEAAVQLHGGIGFTWELDAHLYLRRAWANAASLGDADHHRDRIGARLQHEFDEDADRDEASA